MTAPEARAEQQQPDDHEQVGGDRGGVRRRQVVPAPTPRQCLLEGDVEQVVERAVGVAPLDVDREALAVERIAVDDPVGADHARVAHVDHVRVEHVQADAGGEQDHQGHRQPRDRQMRDQATLPRLRPHSREENADEQVTEHRVHERHRDADLAPVEEDVRDPEGEQYGQVQVEQPRRPAQVDERKQEQRAQGQPDVRGVELAAEGSVVAARHRPGDLMTRPLLEDRAAAVIHAHLDDLVAVPEEAHLPAARAVHVGGRPEPTAPPLVAHLVRARGDRDRLSGTALEKARRLRLGGRSA